MLLVGLKPSEILNFIGVKVDGETVELEVEEYENIGWIGISVGLRLFF